MHGCESNLILQVTCCQESLNTKGNPPVDGGSARPAVYQGGQLGVWGCCLSARTITGISLDRRLFRVPLTKKFGLKAYAYNPCEALLALY